MIDYLKNKWTEHQDAKKAEANYIKSKRLGEIAEDLRISNNNARYLRGHITVSNMVVNNLKGKSVGETRQIRDTARKQIIWFEKKLEEELGYVEYFKAQLA